MKAHVAFLEKYYAAGNFLVSGRKIPRDGGIILAVGADKQQIEAIVKEDPFHKQGLAEFRIIEFRASQARGRYSKTHRGLILTHSREPAFAARRRTRTTRPRAFTPESCRHRARSPHPS
ncbi:MAG: YciI family protein [Pseudomonadota bacterium]